MVFAQNWQNSGGRQKMLRIAVCDDDAGALADVVQCVEAYFRARPMAAGRTAAFSDGRKMLMQAQAEGSFDLYLLDILMPELSGIEVGRRLRANGDDGEIVFLTNVNDFAADSYDVRALSYLLKPVERETLFAVLDRAVEKRLHRRRQAVVVSTRDGQQRLLFDRILYVERTGRVVRYCCEDRVVESRTLRTAFREMAAPLLADRRFCLCGASFVVNLEHVSGVNGCEALLDNGVRLSLPRTSAAAFKNAWGKFWLEG